MLRTYQPKKRQRSKVHGIRKRMATAKGYYASADSVTGRHSFFFSVQHAVLQTGAPAAQGGAL